MGHAKVGFCVFGTHKSGHLCMGGVGVYTVMVCRWTDHILARNPLLGVEADLS